MRRHVKTVAVVQAQPFRICRISFAEGFSDFLSTRWHIFRMKFWDKHGSGPFDGMFTAISTHVQ